MKIGESLNSEMRSKLDLRNLTPLTSFLTVQVLEKVQMVLSEGFFDSVKSFGMGVFRNISRKN